MSGTKPVRTPSGVVNVEPVDAPRGAKAAATATPAATARRGAKVRVRNLDTWSVMRTSFVLSLAIAVVIVVAIAVLWVLFSATGVFAAVGRTGDDILGSQSHPVEAWLSFPRVFGITLIVAVIEVVLTTAAITLLAALYNLAAGWVGGIEATLSEDR